MSRKRTAALALVTALGIVGCSSGGGGGATGGTATLKLTGGTASGSATGSGGEGGYLFATTYTPGGVKLVRSGAADTSFTVPRLAPPVELGPNGVTISSSVTVARLAAGDADPGAGVLYTVDGYWNLYRADGAGTVPQPAEVITGLSVAAGATLTLALNEDSGGIAGSDVAYYQFSDDVEIAGTLKVPALTTVAVNTDERHGATATSGDMGGLEIDAAKVFIRSGGKVDARGADAAAGSDARGGDGGAIYLYTSDFAVNDGTLDASGGNGNGTGIGGDAGRVSGWGWGTWVGMDANGGEGLVDGAGGVVINRGHVLASGGQGATGGACSRMGFNAAAALYNTGDIAANGGTGTAAAGGSGDCELDLYAFHGSTFNSGHLSIVGGDGATGGATGGTVYLSGGRVGDVGDVVNSGAITVSGGSAKDAGSGAGAGSIYFYAHGGVRTSGALTLDGGAGKGGAGGGGGGGFVEVEIWSPYDRYQGYELPMRPIQISGNLSLVGGAASGGGDGGGGGGIELYQTQPDGSATTTAGIELLGYASEDASGGNGPASGGNAGSYALEIETHATAMSSGEYLPAGAIENEMDLIARGGNGTGTNGSGGSGAESGLDLQVSSWELNVPGTGFIRNSGNVDVSGGSATGTATGGDSGGIELYAPGDITNTGRVLNRGGDAVDGTGGEGNYYQCRMASGGDVVNSGDILTDGGRGKDGGVGSDYWNDTADLWATTLYAGGQVRNSATLSSRGGASTDATAGASGAGGFIELFGETRPTQSTGRLDVSPGDGGLAASKGEVGQIWIDSVNVTPASGVL